MNFLDRKIISRIKYSCHAQGGAISCFNFNLYISKTKMINNNSDICEGAIFVTVAK